MPSLTFTIGTCVIPPVLIMLIRLSFGILARTLIAIAIRILRSHPRQHSPWRAAAKRSSCRHEGSSMTSWMRRRQGREESHGLQLPAVEEQLLGLQGRRYVDSGRHEGREDRGGRGEDHQEVLQGVRNLQPCSPGWWSISSSVQRAAAAAATADSSSSVAGRCKLLLPLPCSAEIGRTILSRLPADHRAPRHRRRTRGGP